MKFFLHIFTLLSLSVTTFAQSDSGYREDATQLALRWMQEKQIRSADISPAQIEEIHLALQHILNSGLEEVRLIKEVLKIHAFQHANMHKVHIFLDESTPWVQNLLTTQQVDPTAAPLLAHYIHQYQLDSKIDTRSGMKVLTLFSETPLNMKYISREMSKTSTGVLWVDIPAEKGDRNDISFTYLADGTLEFMFHYKYACGPKDARCKKQHIWRFQVRNHDIIDYEEIGDELPILLAQLNEQK